MARAVLSDSTATQFTLTHRRCLGYRPRRVPIPNLSRVVTASIGPARMWIRLIIAAMLFPVFVDAAYAESSQSMAFVAYKCQHKRAAEIGQMVRPLLPRSDTVQLVVDEPSNRLLVSGPDMAHAITRRVISEVDRPAAPRPPVLGPSPTQPGGMPVSPALSQPMPPNRSLATVLQQATPPQGGAVVPYPRNMSANFAGPYLGPSPGDGRVMPAGHFGPPEGSNSSENRLPAPPGPMPPLAGAQGSMPIAAPQATTQPSEVKFPATSTPASIPPASTGRFLYVAPDKLPRVEQQLSAIFSQRIRVQRLQGREIWWLEVKGTSANSSSLEIEFDRLRSGVLVAGPEPAVSQLLFLAQALASDQKNDGTRTQVLRVQRKNHSSIEQLLRPRGGSNPAAASPTGGLGQRSPQSEVGSTVVQASFLAQMEATPPGLPAVAGTVNDGEEGVLPNANGPAVGMGPNSVNAAARQFEGVEIESLPDLDVLILRGRDQDLEQLSEIIQQLERLSQETHPDIQIFNLQHAQSESVARVVAQTSKDLVGGRQGRVSVTPLVKPNSLLVIGWGDAVKSVMQLIQQLDTPLSAGSQFQVFHLQHASAAAVQANINSFFSNRAGLSSEVRVTVDSRTNTVIVAAAPRDMLEVQRLVTDLDRADSGAVNRAQVFNIQNALATDIAQTLQQAIRSAAGDPSRSSVLELQTLDAEGQRLIRSGTLDRVQITPNPRNNTLIVSSPSENMELIAELIRQLDTPAIQVQIKVFRIVNGDAGNLVQTLRSLIPSQAGTASDLQVPNSPDESSLAPLRFSVDVRSNSIIATGSEGDLRIVEALLVKLDQTTSLQRKTVVYQLKNSPAVDVAAAVNQFLVNRRQIDLAAPGSDNPYQSIEREVVVIPEPVANKLILSATPRYFEEMNDLIERLDEQPPQVVIQVLIAEVALNSADEFGVELGLQDSVLFDRSLLGDLASTTSTQQTSTPAGIVTSTQQIIQAATNTPGFGFNSVQPLGNSGSDRSLQTANVIGGQGISNFAVGRGNDTLGFGGLVLSASSQNVSLLVRALQESRRAEILSRPQIRTLDNQPAFIQVGQRVPRIVGSTVNQNGQSNSVSLENVGLIIGVTPRVSPDGMVVMEIDAEKSAVGPEAEGIPVAVSTNGTIIRSPRVDTATAQATVSAASGETIVLGGLITTSSQEIHRQVPFLGDIPLLGNLFRFDSEIAKRSELLIILTPHVIRTAADSERLKQAEMARMSWCAADVTMLHDGVSSVTEPNLELLDSSGPKVIYPDVNPRGDAPEAPTPAPLPEAPAPQLELPNPQP